MNTPRALKLSDTFHMRVIPFPSANDPMGMKYTIVEEWHDETGKVICDSRRQVSSETFHEFARSVYEALIVRPEDFK